MQKYLFSLTACAALVACGGGGDSSVAGNNGQNDALIGAAVPLSTSNYEPAAKEVLGSVAGLNSTSSVSQALLSGAEVSSMPTPDQFLQAKLPELAQILKRRGLLTGVTVTDTLPCDNPQGEIGIVANDNNNNDELDAGDTVVLSVNNCVLKNLKINGTMSLKIDSGTTATYSNSTPQSITLTSSFQDFKAELADISYVNNGSYTMTISPMTTAGNSGSLRVVYPSLTNQLTQAGKTKVFQYKNFDLKVITGVTTRTWSVKGNVSVPTLGANTADIETKTDFSAPNNSTIASAGQVLITVKNGGKMKVSATGTTKAKVELDLNADGTYEESKEVLWVDIL